MIRRWMLLCSLAAAPVLPSIAEAAPNKVSSGTKSKGSKKKKPISTDEAAIEAAPTPAPVAPAEPLEPARREPAADVVRDRSDPRSSVNRDSAAEVVVEPVPSSPPRRHPAPTHGTEEAFAEETEVDAIPRPPVAQTSRRRGRSLGGFDGKGGAGRSAGVDVNAAGGFVFGIGFGTADYGSVRANDIRSTAGLLNALVLLGRADSFASALANDGESRTYLDLQLGWNILGHVTLAATASGSFWDPSSKNRGGVGFAGGRATWYPLEAAQYIPGVESLELGSRWYDVGLEWGGGYSVAGGRDPQIADNHYGMDGTYTHWGVQAEVRPLGWLTVGGGYRSYSATWDRFIIDLNDDEIVDTPGYNIQAPVWNLSLTFHPTGR